MCTLRLIGVTRPRVPIVCTGMRSLGVAGGRALDRSGYLAPRGLGGLGARRVGAVRGRRQRLRLRVRRLLGRGVGLLAWVRVLFGGRPFWLVGVGVGVWQVDCLYQ